MIEQIKNFTLKSFKDYTGPDDHFLKNNVIFGYNGKGKSSLAKGVLKEFLDLGNNIDCARFYNRDYIEESLLLQNPDGKNCIKGVIANFGKKATDIEKRIEEKEKSKVDTETIKNNINEQEINLRNDIDSIHDRRKGTANIQRKPINNDVLKVCALYNEDLKNALKIEKDEEKLGRIIGDKTFENNIEQLHAININEINVPIENEIEQIKDIFNRSFDNIDIPSSNIIEWLNEGVAIHELEDEDKCQFCGNNINLQAIQERVKIYNEDARQKSILILKEFKKKLEDMIGVIEQNQQQHGLVSTLLNGDDVIENDFHQISDNLKIVESFIAALNAKINNICDSSIEYVNISNNLQNIKESTDEIKESITNEIKRNGVLISNRDALVKGAIGLEINKSTNIQKQLDTLKTLKKNLADGETKNKKINEEIRDLRNSKNATSTFAKFISGILKEIGIRFKVEIDSDNNNYIIKNLDSGDKLEVSDISEGERNILALIFFYYELFNDDKQETFKKDIDLIIIDDPISSLDEINHMYIINLIEQILELPTPQVFVFTHSWEDFSTINYKFKEVKDNPKNRFFEVKKDEFGNSLITKANMAINPYHHHFQEVYNFSQKPDANNLNECEIYHIPNIMRQVLEGFLKFKIRNNSATKSNEKHIAEVLLNDNWANLKEGKKTQLGELLLTINVDSHRPTRNPEEVLKSAKFLMKRIEAADKQHYNTYKEI